MRAVDQDGGEIDVSDRGGMPRGEQLSEQQVRYFRDLIGSLLMDGAHLSPADAARVVSKGASRDALVKRVKQIPPRLRRRFRDLAGEILGNAKPIGRV